MSAPDHDLGRRRGLFVPAAELLLYELQGWRLVDDLAGRPGSTNESGDALVMIEPPPELEREATNG